MILPTSVEPVKESLRIFGMVGERAAAFRAVAGQHVEHARRQELLADLGHQQHAQRRVLGRLQHHRVAGARARARS